MSYTQNNPLSRKNSPLNKDDQWIQKATADIKERGTEGVCTGDKFGGPTCPPGSKRYNLAKTFKKMAKDRKGGPSRESSEEEYMPIEDDMHKKGEGDMGMSRKPYGGNKGDEKRSVRDYEGPSRKSSSPLNNTGMTGLNYSKELEYMPIEDDMNRGMSRESSEGKQIRSAVKDLRKANRKRKRGEYSESSSHHTSAKETYTDLSDKGKTKAHKKMGRTLGSGKQWIEQHGEGPSRESSSPLNEGSWAYEDAKRAEGLYEKGDYAHARALGIDEHDADYGKWRSSEAEHGPSRHVPGHLSAYEGVDPKSLHPYDDGAGGIDYEKMAKDSTNTKKKMMMQRDSIKPMKMKLEKNIKPLPKKRVPMKIQGKAKQG